ncbi:NAD-dependent deacetylase sirtuin-6 [Plakobranchus ocellatus]|uniref:NAD-dependent deacetylase sirtuin-6 n=1 Tax=Plakobranchus ocellatus TaxID=259542 RepID=A0AAV3XXA4_9GAST|nr:NAD-dependent deacetylase sirtuin-6 [Plakobranchus ocellatus]
MQSLRRSVHDVRLTTGLDKCVHGQQTSGYATVCLKKGPDDQLLGSRVFGDCDILMKQVMSQLLTPEELQSWQGERQSRLVEYKLKREQPSTKMD